MVKNILAIFMLALIGLEFGTQAVAGDYVYTDDRCKNAVESGVICMARMDGPTTVKKMIGPYGNFEKFVKLNKDALPKDVTLDTVLPARTVYLTHVK